MNPIRISIVLIMVAAYATCRADDAVRPVASADLYFPAATEWETVTADAADWDVERLDKAVDFAMSRKSSGVVILHRGRILAERYQKLNRPSLRYRGMVHGVDDAGRAIEDVASVQKSIVSVLVGIAQEKGLVKISDPASTHLGKGWSKASAQQESAITLRHLITMSSGLNDRLEFAAAPGTKWKYNTNAYAKSLSAVAAAAEKSENELTRDWLTKPLGMNDSKWIERRRVNNYSEVANRFGFATTARDLARFGLLILARGRWGETVVLRDQKYLTAALTPSQKLNQSYGYLWWLNGQKTAVRAGRQVAGPLVRTAPNDLAAALGALGRKCYVVPSLELVVTRLGDTSEGTGQARFDGEFWRLLMDARLKRAN